MQELIDDFDAPTTIYDRGGVTKIYAFARDRVPRSDVQAQARVSRQQHAAALGLRDERARSGGVA